MDIDGTPLQTIPVYMVIIGFPDQRQQITIEVAQVHTYDLLTPRGREVCDKLRDAMIAAADAIMKNEPGINSVTRVDVKTGATEYEELGSDPEWLKDEENKVIDCE